MSSDRQRKLDAVVAKLQLQSGPRAVRKAAPAPEPIAHLSTTFPELDTALGGGRRRGRITEIIGPATSGKVTSTGRRASANPSPAPPSTHRSHRPTASRRACWRRSRQDTSPGWKLAASGPTQPALIGGTATPPLFVSPELERDDLA